MSTIGVRMALISNIISGLNGFKEAYISNFTYVHTDALQRGGSPDKVQLIFNQAPATAVAGLSIGRVFEALRFGGPSAATSIFSFMFILPFIIQAWLAVNVWISEKGLKLEKEGYKKIAPVIKAMSRFVLYPINRVLHFIEKNIAQFSLALEVAAYVGLLFLGQAFLAAAALATLALGALDRMNLLPMSFRNFNKRWGSPIAIVLGIALGTLFEKMFMLALIPIHYGSALKRPLAYVLSFFNYTKPMSDMLNAQNQKVNKFIFKTTPSEFIKSIDKMNKMERVIVRKHTEDNSGLLPPKIEKDNLKGLIKLFDNIPWKTKRESISKIITSNREFDNRLQEAEARGITLPKEGSKAQYNADITYLKNNLNTFIRRIRKNDILTGKVDGEALVRNRTKAIIQILENCQKELKNPKTTARRKGEIEAQLIGTVVRLGFQTGDFCGDALLRVTRDEYRSLFSNSKFKLEDGIKIVLQDDRNAFFEQHYSQKKTSLWERVNGWTNKENTHMHAAYVHWYAPRLGLPADYADIPTPEFLKDLLSAFSYIERKFWNDHMTIPKAKKLITLSFNTSDISAQGILEWWFKVIDKHVVGTEEQKDKLKEIEPYTVEFHGNVPFYRPKDSILNLMLLDAGILALKEHGNKFVNLKKVKSKSEPLKLHSKKGIFTAKHMHKVVSSDKNKLQPVSKNKKRLVA